MNIHIITDGREERQLFKFREYQELANNRPAVFCHFDNSQSVFNKHGVQHTPVEMGKAADGRGHLFQSGDAPGRHVLFRRIQDHLAAQIHPERREVECVERYFREYHEVCVGIKILPHSAQHSGKISHVHIRRDGDDAFGERKLSRAHQPQCGLHRLLLVPFIDRDDEQIVKSRFVVCPEISDFRMQQARERTEHLLRCIAEKFVLHRRTANDRGGINRILAMCDGLYMEDWKFRCGGVMAEVIAERPFHSAFFRRDQSFEDKLGVCRNADGDGSSADKRRSPSAEETCEHGFIDSFRQRRDCRHQQGWIGTERHGDFERLMKLLGLVIMEAAPFLNLPVHAGSALVEHMHPVHTHVPVSVAGIIRDDLGQGDEATAVIRPAFENRKLLKIRMFYAFLR